MQEKFYNPIIERVANGFLDNRELSDFRGKYVMGEIKKEMEYRPDLVAYYYLNDSTLGWMITYINDFFNGVSDYKVGRKIKIPII